MDQNTIEFKRRLEKTLGELMPKPEDIKLSAITRRIILSQGKYNQLQSIYAYKDYNMWCAGMNKHVDPSSDPMIPVENYIEVGDAQRFEDLFITEREAELEAKEIATT